MSRRFIRQKTKKKLIAAAILAVVVMLFISAFNNLKPVVQTICESQAKILCTSAVNKAVVSELKRLCVDYDSLIRLSHDETGRVSVIETNAVEVNKLKALLTDAVNETIAEIPEQNVRVPLGTLTGIELLSGRGPKIAMKMVPSSYVESSLSNKFDSAGINQTRHQIMIEFKVTMTAILAPYSTSVNVVTNICIAETVIIGTVPDTFADIS